MAINIYAVAPNFPAGLSLVLLVREMRAVWPADLHMSEYSHRRGRPGSATGTLEIETPRVLTAPEEAAALAHFQVHAGGTAPVGIMLAELPGAAERMGGAVFVSDAARKPGPNGGNGTMLYSDGANWRRFADDEVMA